MGDPTIDSESLLRPIEASRLLRVSVSTVKRWIDAGEIHSFRTLGGHRRFRQGDLVKFARKNGIPLRGGGISE